MATFTSTDQTITAGGSLTLAHSLGSSPKIVDYFLVCQQAERGWSVGDVIRPVLSGSGSASDPTGCIVVGDATNLNVRFANNGSNTTFSAVQEDTSGGTTHNVFSLTDSKWKIRFHARTAEATSFTATDQTISDSTNTTVAHGLGTTPTFLSYALVCQTAEQNYSVGDVVWCMNTGVATGNATGITVRPDGTNLNIIWGGGGSGVFNLLNKTTGASFRTTDNKWKVRFYGGTGSTQATASITSSGSSANVTAAGTVLVIPSLKCTTADQGYSVNDVVFPFDTGRGGNNGGCTIRRNSTGRYCTAPGGANVFPFYRKDTNTYGSATDASWNLQGCRF